MQEETVFTTTSNRSNFLGKIIAIILHPSGLIGTLILLSIISLALFGSSLIKWEPNVLNTSDLLQGPTVSHVLGTDQMGRDQLARVADAIPMAFLVPFGAVAVALTLGSAIGIVAGYLEGYWERLLMWRCRLSC